MALPVCILEETGTTGASFPGAACVPFTNLFFIESAIIVGKGSTRAGSGKRRVDNRVSR